MKSAISNRSVVIGNLIQRRGAADGGARSRAYRSGARVGWACLSWLLVACTAEPGQGNVLDGVSTTKAQDVPETLENAAPTFTFRNEKSDLCMGVDHASTDPGANLKQFTCDGAANQRWEKLNAGVDKDYWRNKKSKLCIGVDDGSTDSGANIRQFRCDTRDNQVWTYDNDSGSLKNLNSGLCIGVDGASTADGAQLKQFECDGRDNQGWSR